MTPRQAGLKAVMAELLTFVHVGDVHLDNGAAQASDAVLKCYAGVGVCAGIEHDAVVREANLLHLVDQLAFDVALIVVDGDVWILGFQLRQIALEELLP